MFLGKIFYLFFICEFFIFEEKEFNKGVFMDDEKICILLYMDKNVFLLKMNVNCIIVKIVKLSVIYF